MLKHRPIAKSVLWVLVAACSGAIIGGLTSLWWISTQLEVAGEITNRVHRAQLQEEAFEQYRKGNPHVAIYALQLSLKESFEYAASPNNKRGGWWDVALTHARLGKIYSQIGETSNAHTHFDKAIEAFGRDGWKLRDFSELTAALELIDRNRVAEAVERFGAASSAR